MELSEALSTGEVSVTFTKVSGEERTMRCTKLLDKIPSEFQPKDSGRKHPEDVTAVFDLDKNDWRSFRNDSVKEWSCL